MGTAHYDFDDGAAVDAIREFNRTPSFVAADYVMHEHFPRGKHWTDPAEAAVGVVLVDGLWATQLFRDPGAADVLANILSTRSDDLWPALGRLADDELKCNPDTVYRTAKPFLEALLNPDTTSKRHYSFATKFLHWCTRRHFPIVDDNARWAINRLQRRTPGTRRRVLAPGFAECYSVEYERWVSFYSILWNSLTPQQVKQLADADYSSQPRSVRAKNHLLRVLDKVFYMWGRNRPERRPR